MIFYTLKTIGSSTIKESLVDFKIKSRKKTNFGQIFQRRPVGTKFVGKSSLSEGDFSSEKSFWNQTFDKGRLKNFVLWFLLKHGEYKTVKLVEELKTLGFEYATKAGISLGIEDLKIPKKKNILIMEAEQLSISTIKQYKRNEITGVERFQRLIDTWHRTSERLKQEVIENFEATDILNPVYMMAFSGARGNISQVRQLVGMRGLMSNPQGQIIDFPIRSNFREGLTLTEYIISSYGARKGIVDTALRTANAGYLTRRLVDVAQHVIISNFDCGTKRGIFLTDMKEGNKTIYSLQNRLIGRVLARDVFRSAKDSPRFGLESLESNTDLKNNRQSFLKIASRNVEISSDLSISLASICKKVFVRSALTCQTKNLVCQLCYGWSLAQGNLVGIGEAVGVVAAQSIGEPGTQLTMRTFHTGGVFSGDVSDQIRAPFNGIVIYDNPIAGTLIRTPEGKIGFLTKNEGSFTVLKNNITSFKEQLSNFGRLRLPVGAKKFKIPFYTLLFFKNGEKVIEKEVIAQISSINRQKNATDQAEFTINAELSGQFFSKYLNLKENKVGPKLKGSARNKSSVLKEEILIEQFDENIVDTIFESWGWGYAWVLSGKIYQLPLSSTFFPIIGDFVNHKTYMNKNKLSLPSNFGTSLKLSIPLPNSVGHNVFFNKPNIKKMRTAAFGKNKNFRLNQNLAKDLKKLSENSQRYKKFDRFFTTKKNISSSQLLSKASESFKNNFEPTEKTPRKIASDFKLKTSAVNSLNYNQKDFTLLKTELISFQLSKITYQKLGYFLKLAPRIKSNALFPGKLCLAENKFDLMQLSTQSSILSDKDTLFLFSSLAKSGLSKFKKNKFAYPVNWSASFDIFLNWFPKRFSTKTGGLILIEPIFLKGMGQDNSLASKVLQKNNKISLFTKGQENLASVKYFKKKKIKNIYDICAENISQNNINFQVPIWSAATMLKDSRQYSPNIKDSFQVFQRERLYPKEIFSKDFLPRFRSQSDLKQRLPAKFFPTFIKRDLLIRQEIKNKLNSFKGMSSGSGKSYARLNQEKTVPRRGKNKNLSTSQMQKVIGSSLSFDRLEKTTSSPLWTNLPKGKSSKSSAKAKLLLAFDLQKKAFLNNHTSPIVNVKYGLNWKNPFKLNYNSKKLDFKNPEVFRFSAKDWPGKNTGGKSPLWGGTTLGEKFFPEGKSSKSSAFFPARIFWIPQSFYTFSFGKLSFFSDKAHFPAKSFHRRLAKFGGESLSQPKLNQILGSRDCSNFESLSTIFQLNRQGKVKSFDLGQGYFQTVTVKNTWNNFLKTCMFDSNFSKTWLYKNMSGSETKKVDKNQFKNLTYLNLPSTLKNIENNSNMYNFSKNKRGKYLNSEMDENNIKLHTCIFGTNHSDLNIYFGYIKNLSNIDLKNLLSRFIAKQNQESKKTFNLSKNYEPGILTFSARFKQEKIVGENLAKKTLRGKKSAALAADLDFPLKGSLNLPLSDLAIFQKVPNQEYTGNLKNNNLTYSSNSNDYLNKKDNSFCPVPTGQNIPVGPGGILYLGGETLHLLKKLRKRKKSLFDFSPYGRDLSAKISQGTDLISQGTDLISPLSKSWGGIFKSSGFLRLEKCNPYYLNSISQKTLKSFSKIISFPYFLNKESSIFLRMSLQDLSQNRKGQMGLFNLNFYSFFNKNFLPKTLQNKIADMYVAPTETKQNLSKDKDLRKSFASFQLRIDKTKKSMPPKGGFPKQKTDILKNLAIILGSKTDKKIKSRITTVKKKIAKFINPSVTTQICSPYLKNQLKYLFSLVGTYKVDRKKMSRKGKSKSAAKRSLTSFDGGKSPDSVLTNNAKYQYLKTVDVDKTFKILSLNNLLSNSSFLYSNINFIYKKGFFYFAQDLSGALEIFRKASFPSGRQQPIFYPTEDLFHKDKNLGKKPEFLGQKNNINFRSTRLPRVGIDLQNDYFKIVKECALPLRNLGRNLAKTSKNYSFISTNENLLSGLCTQTIIEQRKKKFEFWLQKSTFLKKKYFKTIFNLNKRLYSYLFKSLSKLGSVSAKNRVGKDFKISFLKNFVRMSNQKEFTVKKKMLEILIYKKCALAEDFPFFVEKKINRFSQKQNLSKEGLSDDASIINLKNRGDYLGLKNKQKKNYSVLKSSMKSLLINQRAPLGKIILTKGLEKKNWEGETLPIESFSSLPPGTPMGGIKKSSGRTRRSEQRYQGIIKKKDSFKEKVPINFVIKPGWPYFTNYISNFILYNKKLIQPGKVIGNELIFDRESMFLEIIPFNDVISLLTVNDNLSKSYFSYTPFTLLLNSNLPKTSINPVPTGQNLPVRSGVNENIFIKENNNFWVTKSVIKNKKCRYYNVNIEKSNNLNNSPYGTNSSIFFKNKPVAKADFHFQEKTVARGENSFFEQSNDNRFFILLRSASEYKVIKDSEYKKEIHKISSLNKKTNLPIYLHKNAIFSQNITEGKSVTTTKRQSGVKNLFRGKAAACIINSDNVNTGHWMFGSHFRGKVAISNKFRKTAASNTSFNTINLFSEFKTELLNKQKIASQTISKFPVSSLQIFSNSSFYSSFVMLKQKLINDCLKAHILGKNLNVSGRLALASNNTSSFNLPSKSTTKLFSNKQTSISIVKPIKGSLVSETKFVSFNFLQNSIYKEAPITAISSINLSPLILSSKFPFAFDFLFKIPMRLFSEQYNLKLIFNNNNNFIHNLGINDSSKIDSDFLKSPQKAKYPQKVNNTYVTQFNPIKKFLNNYLFKIHNLKKFKKLSIFESNVKTTTKSFVSEGPFRDKDIFPLANIQTINKNNLIDIKNLYKVTSILSSFFYCPLAEYSLGTNLEKSLLEGALATNNLTTNFSPTERLGQNNNLSTTMDTYFKSNVNNVYNKNFLTKKYSFSLSNRKIGFVLGSLNNFLDFRSKYRINKEIFYYKTEFESFRNNQISSLATNSFINTYTYCSFEGELIFVSGVKSSKTVSNRKILEIVEQDIHNLENSLFVNKRLIDSCMILTKKDQISYYLKNINNNSIEKNLSEKTFLTNSSPGNINEGPESRLQRANNLNLDNTQLKFDIKYYAPFFLEALQNLNNISDTRKKDKNLSERFLKRDFRGEGEIFKNFARRLGGNYKEIYFSLENLKKKNQYLINDTVIKFLNILDSKEDNEFSLSGVSNKIKPENNQNFNPSPTDPEKTSLKIKIPGHNFSEFNFKINKVPMGMSQQTNRLLLGELLVYGDQISSDFSVTKPGQIIHINNNKITIRKGQSIFVSPKAILHKYDTDFIEEQSPVITLSYQQLKTGDIIEGIPKVEQFFEARTTKRGRLFRDSLSNLLKGLFKRYCSKGQPLDQAVRQSFYKIQQIIVDGVQRVYRSQGVSIADKHLEVIVKQMTSKVRIIEGGQTGFFPGEIVDLNVVEEVNSLLMRKISYEPLVLGITKASLEVDSFLSAASFQQTTRVLSNAAISKKKDFLKGLKENVILGNLIPAGTGYLVYLIP